MNPLLARKLEQLPPDPGVYLFRDAAGGLLYVGKARSLRARVRSYFHRRGDERLATFFIERKVDDLEFVVTRSEKEALLLENNLIKKLKPLYNLRLRDDKTFLSIRVDVAADFPRLVPTRRIKKDGALYFGPYANAGAIRRTLRFLRAFVPLRDCKDSDFRSRTRPCLEFEIGRCSAPCVGLVDAPGYARLVERAVALLRGETRELEELLRAEMQRASEKQQFERAAQLRDFIQGLQQSLERQEVDAAALGDVDAVGVWREGGLVEVVVLFVRQGKIVSSAGFTFEHDLADDELLSEFLTQFYAGGRPVPPEVLLPTEAYGREALEEWLSEKREARVFVRVPQRGAKARLLELARDNARLTLLASTDKQQRTAKVLDRLRELLGLTRPPLRVECFDVSTTGGLETVASCVQFRDGEPFKSRYRKFRIRHADPQDEYGSMREVLTRHLRRSLADQELPDLLIVDGGKGQWNVARRVMDELGVKNVDLVALAKGDRRGTALVLKEGEEERVFTQGEGEGIVLDPAAPATLLLQRIRDEAHRFAITFHRKRRAKQSLASDLEKLPRLAREKKALLLARFGSVEGLRGAAPVEIAGVLGVSVKAATRILAALGRGG